MVSPPDARSPVNFGIRVNLLEDLAYVVSQVKRLGLEPSQDVAEVDSLISYHRAAESQRRGQRNYHLLFVDANRRARTFSEAELREKFEENLLGEIEPSRTTIVAFWGVVRNDGQEYVAEFLRKDQALPNDESVIASGKLFLTPEGEFRNPPRGQISAIHIPQSPGFGGELGEGSKLALLLAYCFSEASYAIPHLKQLSENVRIAMRDNV